MRRVVAYLVLLACSTLGASASAQPCEGNDAFSASRRARRVLDDIRATDRDVDRDVAQLKANQALAPDGHLRSYSYGVALGEGALYAPVRTCTLGAGTLDGTLGRTRVGLLAGHDTGTFDLRVHWVHAGDHLSASSGRDARGAAAGPTAAATAGQEALGGSVAWSGVVRVGVSRVVSHAPAFTGDAPLASAPSGKEATRMLFHAGFPALHLDTDVVTDASGGRLELASVRSTRMRAFDSPLLVTVGTSFIADERQVATLGGLTWQRWSSVSRRRPPSFVRTPEKVSREGTAVELSAEASGEHRSGRLRHARVRVEGIAQGDRAFPRAVTYGPTYLRAGIFAEATSFGGAYFASRTGRDMVFGGGGGAYGVVGTRIVTLRLDVYGGANRPEALARASELSRRGELAGNLYVRLGW